MQDGDPSALSGLLAGTECGVYGFVRKKGLLDAAGSETAGRKREDGLSAGTETMAVGQGKIRLGK